MAMRPSQSDPNPKLAAPCQIPPAHGKPPDEEYKALRDEIMHLFNRVFVVLAAEVTAFATLSVRSLSVRGLQEADLVDTSMTAILALLVLAAGAFLTCLFYQNAFSIGSYLLVFYEHPNHIGWQFHSRRFRLRRENSPPVPRLRWTERINDPQFVSFVYAGILAATVALGLRIHFMGFGLTVDPRHIAWVPTGTAVAVWVLAVIVAYVLTSLWRLYTEGSRRSVEHWIWYRKHNNPPNVEDLLYSVRWPGEGVHD